MHDRVIHIRSIRRPWVSDAIRSEVVVLEMMIALSLAAVVVSSRPLVKVSFPEDGHQIRKQETGPLKRKKDLAREAVNSARVPPNFLVLHTRRQEFATQYIQV
jgi:hypothetical protein